MKKLALKIGDVILIKEYISESDTILATKYFVVIDTKPNLVDNMYYDIIAVPISSIKNEIHRVKVMSNEIYMPLSNAVIKSSDKSSYVRLGKIYFFNKDRIMYKIVDRTDNSTLFEIVDQIENLEQKEKLEFITNNVRTKVKKNRFRR